MKVRLLTAASSGRVHAVRGKRLDVADSKCHVVKQGHETGLWGRRKSLPHSSITQEDCCKACWPIITEALDADTPSNPAPGPAPGSNARKGPQSKASELSAFAMEHGWTTLIEDEKPHEITLTATKDGERLRIIYVDGRVTYSRLLLASGVEVRLRNAANWRRHASGDSGIKSSYKPKVRRPRHAPVDDLAVGSHLPFSPDDPDDVITDILAGRQITWMNSISGKHESAFLPRRGRGSRITHHPKNDKRMINFYESMDNSTGQEILGAERIVMIDKIIDVS